MVARTAPVFALSVVLLVSFSPATAEDVGSYVLGGPTLAVGDAAPRLVVQEYMRGEAVTEFERGKVYVIEFWKCGCPPCRAAIPHLNELQKKYPGAIFISIGVLTPTALNKEYIKRSGDQMGYRVAIDRVPPGKDASVCGAMVQGWLKPAGEEGVPTTFLIDGSGRIAWIGHPMNLDEAKAGRPLRQVIAGTWDLKAAAAKFADSRPDARRGIEHLPKTERDAVHALHERAGRVEVVVRKNTVTNVQFDPRRVTDAVLADLVPDLRRLKGLRDLSLCGADITDTGLKSLRDLATVVYLDISGTGVTDAGLAHLRGWNDLASLVLRDTRVTEVGLKDLGAKPRLVRLDLAGLPVTAGGLRALKRFPELHNLNLSGTGVTDGLLGELQGMPGVRGLDLSDTPITDAGLRALAGTTFGYLNLTNTRVEGLGFRELRGLVGVLNLRGTRVTDAGLAELKQFPDLRQLTLDRTEVTDAGLAELHWNRRLRSLSLNETRVTDAGLQSLRDMKDLERLELRGTRVTNNGLRELERFKALNFLDVARTKVTKARVDDLRAALPNLQIAY